MPNIKKKYSVFALNTVKCILCENFYFPKENLKDKMSSIFKYNHDIHIFNRHIHIVHKRSFYYVYLHFRMMKQ